MMKNDNVPQFFNFNNPDPLYTLKFEPELNKSVHTWKNKINNIYDLCLKGYLVNGKRPRLFKGY